MSIIMISGMMMVLINVFLIFSFNLMGLSLSLCLMAGVISVFLSVMNCSWFFYFLFLVYLGGVMVLIMFIISLNPEMNLWSELRFGMGWMTFLGLLLLSFSNQSISFFMLKSKLGTLSVLSSLFSLNNSFGILLLVFLLLMIMCVVVGLVDSYLGAMVKRL